MTRILILTGLLLWVGTTLLLSELRWFSRRGLADRLGPYVPGGMGLRGRSGLMSVESFREAVGPLARSIGGGIARVLGVGEDLALRLGRVHSPMSVTEFRVRQVGWSVAGLGIGVLASLAIRPPLPVVLLFSFGGMLLAFLLLEQQVSNASRRWQRSVYLELPVVAEQIGMLLGAGYSLMAAIVRVAERGRGSCAADLRRVVNRIRQGVGEEVALREWSQTVDVDAVERLVAVLALNREASDLGRLIGQEARAIRADVHRELIETMDRRSQQVWIPVTVATLLPGVIFVAVPFVSALRVFAG